MKYCYLPLPLLHIQQSACLFLGLHVSKFRERERGRRELARRFVMNKTPWSNGTPPCDMLQDLFLQGTTVPTLDNSSPFVRSCVRFRPSLDWLLARKQNQTNSTCRALFFGRYPKQSRNCTKMHSTYHTPRINGYRVTTDRQCKHIQLWVQTCSNHRGSETALFINFGRLRSPQNDSCLEDTLGLQGHLRTPSGWVSKQTPKGRLGISFHILGTLGRV